MTGVGTLGVFLLKFSARLEDGLLSFATGIGFASSFFSLILPAIEHGEAMYHSANLAVITTILGILCGAVALFLMHRYSPHEHFLAGGEGPDTKTMKRIWLFVIAITLHNVPEGMAVGVGFAGGDVINGTSLATGIGVQNIPEGLAVATGLLSIGDSKVASILIGFLTGLAEPVGACSAAWRYHLRAH